MVHCSVPPALPLTRTGATGRSLRTRSERRHLALVEARPHDRYIHLTVRGPQPQNFFALLREGLELTIKRFPGMKVARTVPCPCQEGISPACPHEFDLEYLEKAIERTPPVLDVQCQKSFRLVSIMGLLFGIHWRMQDKVLEEIDAMRGDVHELLELSQREFLKLFKRDQATVDLQCPNIFTLKPVGPIQTLSGSYGDKTTDWIFKAMELQLYCQAPGHWHPTADGGRYVIKNAAEWIKKISPYLRGLLSILKYSSKAKLGLSINLTLKETLPIMEKLIGSAGATGPTALSLEPSSADGSSLRLLHLLLDDIAKSTNGAA